jgi:hypothetical protein
MTVLHSASIIVMLKIFMLSVPFPWCSPEYLYTECSYTECRYAECHVTFQCPNKNAIDCAAKIKAISSMPML